MQSLGHVLTGISLVLFFLSLHSTSTNMIVGAIMDHTDKVNILGDDKATR